MRNRTRVIAAAAITATLAAGGSAATASTNNAKPGTGTHARLVCANSKPGGPEPAADTDLAARLGVSPARLDRALRAVKTSLVKANTEPTPDQLYAALARNLGIPLARVRQAFPPQQQRLGSKAAKAGRAGSKAAGSKAAEARRAERRGHEALAAAVAKALHVSTARVEAAFRPLFAAGHAELSSPAFVAAARALGVTSRQLNAALIHAKQSLAGCH